VPKKNRAASLVRYGKIDNLGWRRGSIVSSKNGRVKPDAMVYDGKEYRIPASSHYQIRHHEGNKAVYVTVGSDFEVAQSSLATFTASRDLEAAKAALGIITPKAAETPKTLAEHLAEYLAKKKSLSLELSEASIRLYTTTLTGFVRHCGRVCASEVTEGDVVSYLTKLMTDGFAEKVSISGADGRKIRVDGKTKGYSKKSRVMRYTAIRGFLRSCGVQVERIIGADTHKRLAAKPDANTDPYTQEELDRFFSACDDKHRLIFTLLLSTGLRFREANHLTWANVDFKRNVITLQGEQKVNRHYHSRKAGKMVTAAIKSKTKNRKGREVPIFPSLRPQLLKWREQNPYTVFVFGTRSDMPDNHWLGYGKKAWKRAGLNCNTCEGCAKRGECDHFYLHKFRHSFAHRCLDAGIPIHKVSKWMATVIAALTSPPLTRKAEQTGPNREQAERVRGEALKGVIRKKRLELAGLGEDVAFVLRKTRQVTWGLNVLFAASLVAIGTLRDNIQLRPSGWTRVIGKA
jgi:integrase